MDFVVVVARRRRACALDHHRVHLDHVGVGGSASRGMYACVFSLVFDRRRRHLSPCALDGDDLDPVYGFLAQMDCLFENFDVHRDVASCDCIPLLLHLVVAGHHPVLASLRATASSDDRDSHPRTLPSCRTAA